MPRPLLAAALSLSCAAAGACAAGACATADAALAGERCSAAARAASAAGVKEHLLLQLKTPSASRHSARQSGLSPAPCPQLDVDFSGADLAGGQVAGVGSILECWERCRGRAECDVFTLRKEVCYLKASGAVAKHVPGAVSGSRSCGLAFEAAERPDLAAIFAAEDGGYQGADSGASVRLQDKTYIWLWGDTLVGKTLSGGARRSIDRMTRQSLAKLDVIESTPGRPNISALRPQYFQPTEEDQYFPTEWYPIYWLIEGVTGEQTGALFVQVWNIYGGLSGHARTMLVVDNPTAHPDAWQIREGLLPTNSSCNYAHGMYQTPDWIYILGSCDGYAVVARSKENDLNEFRFDELQYWNGQDWTIDSSQQAPLFHMHWCSEASLKWHPVHQMWYVPLLQSIDPTLRLATAPQLTGPWSIQEVYTIPDVWLSSQNRSAYAAKSHPELASDPKSLIISYNTNSMADEHGNWQRFLSENHGMANASVYRLQFVELQPKSLGGHILEFQAEALASEKALKKAEAAVARREEVGARGAHQLQPMRSDLWRLAASGGGGASPRASGKVSAKSPSRSFEQASDAKASEQVTAGITA